MIRKASLFGLALSALVILAGCSGGTIEQKDVKAYESATGGNKADAPADTQER